MEDVEFDDDLGVISPPLTNEAQASSDVMGGPDSMDLFLMDMEIPGESDEQRLMTDREGNVVASSSSTSSAASRPGHSRTLLQEFGAAFRCVGGGDVGEKRAKFHEGGYIGSGELALSIEETELHNDGFDDDDVILFGRSFPADSIFSEDKQQILLNHFCQRMSLLHAEQEMMQLQRQQQHFSWTKMVEELRQFLSHLRRACYNLSRGSSGHDGGTAAARISSLLRLVRAINLHVGRLSDLEQHVLVSSAAQKYLPTTSFVAGNNVESNNRSVSGFLLHLILDVRWTLYASVHFLSLRPCTHDVWRTVDSLVTFSGFPKVSGFTEVGHGCKPLVRFKNELCLQNLFELIYMALSRYDRLRVDGSSRLFFKESPFGCHCDKELWIMMLNHMERSKDNRLQFWSLLEALLPVEGVGQAQYSDQDSLEQIQYKFRTVPKLFVWWLLLSTVPLIQVPVSEKPNEEEEEANVESTTRSYFFLTEDWLSKGSLLTVSNCNELQARINLRVLLTLSYTLGPSLPVLNFLWEHFHRRLNDNFCQTSSSMETLATLPLTSTQWLTMLPKARIDRDEDDDVSNSFQLYLKILELHLTSGKSGEDERRKLFDRVNSRLMSKITARKLKELSMTGWFHFVSLVLQMIRISPNPETCSLRWLKSIDSLKLSELDQRMSVILLRGLGAMALCVAAAAGRGQQGKGNPEQILKAFMARLEHLVNSFLEKGQQQQQQLAQLTEAMSLYSDVLKDTICQNRSSLLSGSHCFVAPCVAKYLRICKSFDQSARIMSNFVVLVTKVRKFHRTFSETSLCLKEEEREAAAEVKAMEEKLWTTLFPVVRRDLCSASAVVRASPELVDFVTAMTMLVMDSPGRTTSGEDSFLELFKYFALSPAVQPSLSSQFLLNFLQQGTEASEKLRIKLGSSNDRGGGGLGIVICGWLRCAILLPDGGGQEGQSNSTYLLSREVFQLPELSRLHPFLPSPHNLDEFESDKSGLQTFLAALGQAHHNRQTLDEIRRDFLPYLSTCVDCIKGTVRRDLPRNVMLHTYKVGALLIEHCANILYVTNSTGSNVTVNLVNPILNELILSNTRKTDDLSLSPQMQEAIAASLPCIIKGLASLPNLSSDAFLRRSLRETYAFYLPRLEVRHGTHPLLFLFTNFVEREKKEALQQHFLEVVKAEFLEGSLPARGPKEKALLSVLLFLREVLKLSRSSPVMELVTSRLCYSLLKLRIRSDCQAVRSATGELLLVLVESNKSVRDRSERDEVLPLLRRLASEDMGFASKEVFKLLMMLKAVDARIIEDLLPFLAKEVEKLETKRGIVNGQSSLKEALKTLRQ